MQTQWRMPLAEVPAPAVTTLEQVMALLPSVADQHAPTTPLFAHLKTVARSEIERRFRDPQPRPRAFPPFGEIIVPYHNMGAIDSLDLFGLNELILFSFYWVNRHRYRRALDIGANIGLHAILLSRCGLDVRAFEPDPQHAELLRRNLSLNRCVGVEVRTAAVSSRAGTREFIRVLGNTTGNHLAGSKPNPYGPLERFPVAVEPIGSIIEWADFLKVDAEGHEKEILLATTREHWQTREAVVEVGTPDNAAALYEHFRALGVILFAQKGGWQPVRTIEEMPMSHHDGSLFISTKPQMPWGEGGA